MTMNEALETGYIEIAGYVDCEGGVERIPLHGKKLVHLILAAESEEHLLNLLNEYRLKL